MKINLSILLLAATLASCSVKPEPLILGKDACYTCKMTLMDERFGGEIVTKKGKVYKFDDFNCMINFSKSGYEPDENIALQLVVDYAQPGHLVDVQKASYCKSDQIKSPMAGQAAAFEKKEDLEKFNSEWKGAVLTWAELVEQSK
jgi:copper chaperone NosL